MSTLGLLVTIVGGLLGLVATAAAVVAVTRANLANGTIETQRQSIVAFETRITQVEAENSRCTARITALEAKNAALEAENATLRSIVTGVDELQRMRIELTAHHDEVKRTHDQLLTGTYAMHDLMIELLKRHMAPPDQA